MESGLNLLLARKRAKLGQKELGEKLGLTRSLISMFENNKVSPTRDTAIDLARILGTEPEALFPEIFNR